MQDISTLDQYLARYGGLLGQQARKALKPLHVPATDVAHVAGLLRAPFEPQAHVIAAGVKSLRRGKCIMVIGECGTGKTLIGQAMAHTHAGGRPYRAIVFCPPHLTVKWARELEQTIPGCSTHQIESYRDLVKLYDRQPPERPEWWITSNNRAKLGSPWRAAYNTHMGEDREGLAYCPSCGEPVMKEDKDEQRAEPMPIEDLHKKRHACGVCGEALWTYVSEIDRWPGADYVKRRLKGVFKYLIVDEVHQEKGAETAQANAMGAIAAVTPKVIALTGTLIGGYADHLRTLMFRLAPTSLVEEGFTWSGHMPFNETYGRIETKIVEKESTRGEDNRYSKGNSKTTKTKYVRPGVMPTLFGRHLLDKCVFLSLEEVAENLPELVEEVIPVYMDQEQEEAYQAIEEKLLAAIKDMVRKGDKRLLGAMLQALICYPDLPFGWPEIGYYDTEEDGSRHFRHVVQPPDLDPRTIRPKEDALVAACVARKLAGRQSWVFTTMTDKRDVCERLKGQLEAAGLRTTILRASVETKKREAWIAKHGAEADVVLSHPQLVETGLDLFDKGGKFNFATLMFYLTGYNLFTLRQASRRAWRVGQQERCEVLYFYYAGTMQARAMELMGKKLAAAEAIEGKFSAEGLAAMAGEESSAEMAMARSLINKLDGEDGDSIRAWNRVIQRGSRLDSAQPLVMGEVQVQNELPATVVEAPRKSAIIIPQRQMTTTAAGDRPKAKIISSPRPKHPMPVLLRHTQRPLFVGGAE